MKAADSVRRRIPALVVLVSLTILAAGCGVGPETGSTGGGSSEPGMPRRVTIGYFANLTHASAIAGVERKTFEKHLGPAVDLKTSIFNAGPQAVESLFAGAVDATYIGPNPAINAFARSKGEAIRIVSGATSGGAALVVRSGIDRPDQLKGKKIASPQLGNTQDVALRAWLKSNGLKTTATGGGDVQVVPQENSQTLETFSAKAIDGAWVPEPWVSRLTVDAGAKILVDEASLWPDGRFVTAHLVVRTEFLNKHPRAVKALVAAQVESSAYLNAAPKEARALVNEAIGKLTGKKLADAVIDQAWTRLQFTNDPLASSLRSSAEHAAALGLLDPVSLDGIYDLSALNQVLAEAGKPAVAA